MPDIILARPAAGQQAAIPAQAQSRIVLDFAPDDATLFRQGDNLVFGFADGGSVSLTDLALPGFPWVADLLMSFPEGTNEGYGPIFSDSRADRALVC